MIHMPGSKRLSTLRRTTCDSSEKKSMVTSGILLEHPIEAYYDRTMGRELPEEAGRRAEPRRVGISGATVQAKPITIPDKIEAVGMV